MVNNMFSPDFSTFEERTLKASIPEGERILTLVDIEEAEKGFKFILSFGEDYFPYKYMFWTHTDKAKSFTNNQICNYFTRLGISRNANISALVGYEFKLTLAQGEKYLEHVGYMSVVDPGKVKPSMVVPSAPVAAAPPVAPVAPRPPVMQLHSPDAPVTKVHTPVPPTASKRLSNGHTVEELLAAGWDRAAIQDLINVEFDDDIPF